MPVFGGKRSKIACRSAGSNGVSAFGDQLDLPAVPVLLRLDAHKGRVDRVNRRAGHQPDDESLTPG